MGRSSRISLRAAALVVVLAVAPAIALLARAPEPARANVMVGVLPLCTTSSFPFSYTNSYGLWRPAIDGPDAYKTSPVGPGIASDCAAQLKTRFENPCAAPEYCPQGTGFELLPTAAAFPNNAASSHGDGQHVQISIPGVEEVSWPHCFPSWGIVQSSICPKYPPGEESDGAMYYRFKDDDGNYTSKFTVTAGLTNPKFRIQRLDQSAFGCAKTAGSCSYEIIWDRTAGGSATQGRDAQVVLQVPIAYTNTLGTLTTGFVAIPMEITVDDLIDVQPGDPPPTQPGDSSPGAVGGGSSGGGGGGGTPGGGSTSGSTSKLAIAPSYRLGAASVLRGGARFSLEAPGRGKATGTLTLPKPLATRLGLGSGAIVVGTASGTAAKHTTLTIKLTGKGRKAVQRRGQLPGGKLRLVLEVSVRDAAGGLSTQTAPVTIF